MAQNGRDRPSFKDLSPKDRALFGNGVGPYWLSDRARNWITQTASWFFKDASWRHHDFGYVVGGDRWDRARCDWKFFRAMVKDALSQPWLWYILAVPIALNLALLFYIAVRIGGQFGSFKYRKSYADLEQVLADVKSG